MKLELSGQNVLTSWQTIARAFFWTKTRFQVLSFRDTISTAKVISVSQTKTDKKNTENGKMRL